MREYSPLLWLDFLLLWLDPAQVRVRTYARTYVGTAARVRVMSRESALRSTWVLRAHTQASAVLFVCVCVWVCVCVCVCERAGRCVRISKLLCEYQTSA